MSRASLSALLVAMALIAAIFSPLAMADDVFNVSNFNANESNLANQTVVVENSNTTVTINAATEETPSPLGIISANMPIVIVVAAAAGVLGVAALRFVKSRKDSDEEGDDDEK